MLSFLRSDGIKVWVALVCMFFDHHMQVATECNWGDCSWVNQPFSFHSDRLGVRNSGESFTSWGSHSCLGKWNTPYHQLLNQACVPDLATCRKHLSFCYFYKLITSVYLYHDLPLVPHSPQHAHHNTRSFMQFNAHTICFHYSFFPHVTSLHSTLPNTHYLLSLFLLPTCNIPTFHTT